MADSGVTATVRMRSSGVFETSWIESTAPSDETQRRGSSRSESALRAYSIDEIGAMSSSPARRRPVELGRDADDLLDLGIEPEEDRRHVDVADAAEPDHSRGPIVLAHGRRGRSRPTRPFSGHDRCRRPFGYPTSRPYAVEASAKNRDVSVRKLVDSRASSEPAAPDGDGLTRSHRRSSL